MHLRALILTVCLTAPVAFGQDVGAIRAYDNGLYMEAADIAGTAGGADNLAFAARALLADAIAANQQPTPERLADVRELAERALDLDERHVEGRLQLAICMSLTARPLSAGAAMRSGLGQKAREIARDVLNDDPENTYAHAYLAVWNVEVVRRGGRIGGTVMGASVKKGRAHYKAAIASDPDDASLHWQWARVLTSLNAKKYREEIEATLAAALASTTDTAIEGVMKERARAIDMALTTRSRDEVEGLAAEML